MIDFRRLFSVFFRFCFLPAFTALRKISFLLLFSSGCASGLFALDFSMKFEPFWSVTFGSVREYVWAQNTASRYDYMLSELLWDVKPLWSGGLKVAAVLEGFELNGSFAFGLTGKSGSMADSDWLNGIQSQKTHFSSHDNFITQYMNVTGSFGYNFKLPKSWIVSPFLSFVYRSIGFTGKDGSGDYPAGWTNGSHGPPHTEVGSGINRETITFSGDVISYEQYIQYFSLGVRASYSLKKWQFDLGAAFIPAAFGVGYDNHWKRISGSEFLDVMYGGLGVTADAAVSFRLNEGASLNAGFSFEYMDNLKGFYFTGENNSSAAFNSLVLQRKNPIGSLYNASKQVRSGAMNGENGVQGGGGQLLFSIKLSVTLSF